MSAIGTRHEEAQSLLRRLWWAILNTLIAAMEREPVRAQYIAIAITFLKHNNIKAEGHSSQSAKGGLGKLQAAMLAEFPGGPGTKQ